MIETIVPNEYPLIVVQINGVNDFAHATLSRIESLAIADSSNYLDSDGLYDSGFVPYSDLSGNSKIIRIYNEGFRIEYTIGWLYQKHMHFKNFSVIFRSAYKISEFLFTTPSDGPR